MADAEPQAASQRKDGRQNALVHEPVTGPSPPYDHNLVADSKIKVLQPDGKTRAPRWNARGKYALPTHSRERKTS